MVTTGERYALLIDNFSLQNGTFTLDFSSSNATLGFKPQLGQVKTSSCGSGSLLALKFSTLMPCVLITPDGSNFTIVGASAISIIGINNSNCITANSTNYLLLNYTGSFIDDSAYVLTYHADSASSGCTVLDDSIVFVPADTHNVVSAGFRFTIIGNQVVFSSDESEGEIVAYQWSFGDGSTSFTVSPIHAYDSNGLYNACLIVIGICENDTLCRDVQIGPPTGIPVLNESMHLDLFPNPTTGLLNIQTDTPSNTSFNAEVFDIFGKQVFRQEQQNMPRLFELNLEALSLGIYFFKLSNDEISLTRRFTILR